MGGGGGKRRTQKFTPNLSELTKAKSREIITECIIFEMLINLLYPHRLGISVESGHLKEA